MICVRTKLPLSVHPRAQVIIHLLDIDVVDVIIGENR